MLTVKRDKEDQKEVVESDMKNVGVSQENAEDTVN